MGVDTHTHTHATGRKQKSGIGRMIYGPNGKLRIRDVANAQNTKKKSQQQREKAQAKISLCFSWHIRLRIPYKVDVVVVNGNE